MKQWTIWFYRYHRWLGLLVGIPMILWTISGICHPLMANFLAKPIARNAYSQPALPLESITYSLQQVLDRHGYDTFRGFRIVLLQEQPYYQIEGEDSQLRYFSCTTGEEYPDAVQFHAETLARWFLDDQTSARIAVTEVTRFGGEYGLINRFLPVYRVLFDRPDQMAVYVDVKGDRLATYSDGTRRALLWVFNNLHSWSFLGERESILRVSVIAVFSLFTMVVAISGIYLFVFMKRGRSKRRPLLRWHRRFGILFSLFLLGFSFSALLVAFPKYREDSDNRRIIEQSIAVSSLPDTLLQTVAQVGEPIRDISLIGMDDRLYYRLEYLDTTQAGTRQLSYWEATEGKLLEEGDLRYARYLFQRASGIPEQTLLEVEWITRFSNDYSFIMKRLPVYRMVSSAAPSGSSWYIETKSGYLAAQKTWTGTVSGLGFIFLHKFHFLDPLGRNFRDGAIIGVCLFLLLISLLGVLSWFRS